MPRGDGTGPMGMGAMTGRGAGYCAGAVEGYGNAGFGRGFGRRCAANWGTGFGYGRGMRGTVGPRGRMASTPVTAHPDTERQWLKNQADALQRELDLVNKRLASMESTETEQQ